MEKYTVTMYCEKGGIMKTRQLGESTSREEMEHLLESTMCKTLYTPGVFIRHILARVIVEENGGILNSQVIKVMITDFSYDSDEDDLE